MTFSEPQRRMAIHKLKMARRHLLAVPIAIVLGIWAPFYPKYLASAAVLGIINGFILWFLFRSPPQSPTDGVPFGPILLMVCGLQFCRAIWLPRNISDFDLFFLIFQGRCNCFPWYNNSAFRRSIQKAFGKRFHSGSISQFAGMNENLEQS